MKVGIHSKLPSSLRERAFESTDLQPISLELPVLKELATKWMVEMAEYFAENLQIIVNSFMKAGITGALDSHKDGQELDQNDSQDELTVKSARVMMMMKMAMMTRVVM